LTIRPIFGVLNLRKFRGEKMKKMQRPFCLAAFGLSLFAAPAVAGVREDILAAMRRCSAIADDRTWLDCTYGAQQPMRARLGLPAAPESQQRLVPPVSYPSARQTDAEAAPLLHRTEAAVEGLGAQTSSRVTSTLVGVRYDKQGGFVATLENGQVWHQVNLVEGAPKVRMTLGARITVQRGSMWSYDLKVDKDSHSFKVDREP
jgi:hypothetical protein